MCKKNIELAIKFIAKNAKRNDFIKRSAAVWEDDVTVYATDGYQVLRTLEDVDETLIDKVDKSIMETINRVFDEKLLDDCNVYDCPNISKLESEIKKLKKESKSKNRPMWKVRIGYNVTEDSRINAEFLLNAMKCTGATEMYNAGRYAPYLLMGEDTQYVILPISNQGNLIAGEINIIH